MNRLITGLAIVLFLWGLPISSSADFYSWTDENGVKHFSNTPPSDAEDVEKEAEFKIDNETREKIENDRQRKQDEAYGKVPKGSSKYVTKNPGKVELYSKKGDYHCRKARRFFKEYSIPYKEYDLDKDEEAKARLEQQYGESYPCIVVGDKYIKGFDSRIFNGWFGIGKKNRSGASISIE